MSVGGINTQVPLAGAQVQASAGSAQGDAGAASAAGTAAVGGGAAGGPAAWNEAWAQKFADLGAPTELVQQLTFTGAMGYDEAQLQEIYDGIKAQVDPELAKFAHDHPEAFKKLHASPHVKKGDLVQIAASMNAGQMKKTELNGYVDTVGKSAGRLEFDTFVKPLLVFSLIPGWGALRLVPGMFNGGKDVLTGERMYDGGMALAFTTLTALGGGITLFNNARGAMQVAQGHRLAAVPGGNAAAAAANEGLANLTRGQKFLSYVPGTRANEVFAGMAQSGAEVTKGAASLKGIEAELHDTVTTRWRAGEVSLTGDPASKLGKAGFQPNTRGMVINSGIISGTPKPMVVIDKSGALPAIRYDNRANGPIMAAHNAAAALDLVDQPFLAKVAASYGIKGPVTKEMLPMLRERVLAGATQQLLDAGVISRPTGFRKVLDTLRPGAVADALRAVDNVKAGTLNARHGLQAGSKALKLTGLVGLGVAGVGALTYFTQIKPMLDAQKQAAAGGGAGAADAAAGAGQITPEVQAALDQFAALPAQQQAQMLQQQQAMLQQASQQPNLTAEQEQAIVAGAQELELYMQVANGQQPGAAAAQQPAAQPQAGAGASGLTAKGLGLAQ